MGEFDLSLIREFRSRPAFYDRNSPLFKDKVFTAREWQLIANKLGYDVSLLKDRMLQLRNRYNLEKRRLEQLREENPGKLIESPWPLYDRLHFLAEHIRTRRSYKQRMLPMQAASVTMSTPPEEHSYSGSELMPNLMTPSFNGMLTVKMEEGEISEPRGENIETSNESDSQSIQTLPTVDSNRLSVTMQMPQLSNIHSITNQQSACKSSHGGTPQMQQSITIRRFDTMRDPLNKSPSLSAPSEHLPVSTPHLMSNHTTNNEEIATIDSIGPDSHVTLSVGTKREQKYAAFGNFLSSSLLELPPQKALLLVEQFTSELVKVMLQKNSAQTDSSSQITTTFCGTKINGQ